MTSYEEGGFVTNLAELPLAAIRYGGIQDPGTQSASYSVGDFKCAPKDFGWYYYIHRPVEYLRR